MIIKHNHLLLLCFLFISNTLAFTQDLPFQEFIIENSNEEVLKRSRIINFQGKGFLTTGKTYKYYDADLKLIKEYTYPTTTKEQITIKKTGLVSKYATLKGKDGKPRRGLLHGFMNTDFELVLPCIYLEIRYIVDSDYLLAITAEGKYKVFNTKGKELLELPDNYTTRGVNGNTFPYKQEISKGNYVHGLMNIKGEQLVELKNREGTFGSGYIFEEVFCWQNGTRRAGLMNNNKDTLWTVNGTLRHIGSGVFEHIKPRDKRKNLLNKQGESLLEYARLWSETNSPYAYVQEEITRNYVLFDKDLKAIAEYPHIVYDVVLDAHLCYNTKSHRNHKVDKYIKDGKAWDEAVFYKTYADNEFGVFPYRDIKNRRYGFMDKEMRVTLQATYEEGNITFFHPITGLMKFKKHLAQGLMNSKGEVVVEAERGRAFYTTPKGVIIKKYNGRYSIFDRELKPLIDLYKNIDDIKFFKNGEIAIHIANRKSNNYNNSAPLPPPSSTSEEDLSIEESVASRLRKAGWQFLTDEGKQQTGIEKSNQEALFTNDLFYMNRRSKSKYNTKVIGNQVQVIHDNGTAILYPKSVSLIYYSSETISLCSMIRPFKQVNLKQGKVTNELFINGIEKAYDGYIVFRKFLKVGIMTDKGELVVPAVLDSVSGIINDKAVISYNRKKYHLDLRRD